MRPISVSYRIRLHRMMIQSQSRPASRKVWRSQEYVTGKAHRGSLRLPGAPGDVRQEKETTPWDKWKVQVRLTNAREAVHLPQVFWIQLPRECGRVRQVTEQHSELATLSVGYFTLGY
jgi:hypothetical protein